MEFRVRSNGSVYAVQVDPFLIVLFEVPTKKFWTPSWNSI